MKRHRWPLVKPAESPTPTGPQRPASWSHLATDVPRHLWSREGRARPGDEGTGWGWGAVTAVELTLPRLVLLMDEGETVGCVWRWGEG